MLATLPHRLVRKTRAYRAEARLYSFGTEVVRIPRQRMFRRPAEFRYDRVTHVTRQQATNAWLVHLEGGQRVRLSSHTTSHHWLMAALRLRLGYACDRRGDHQLALEYYEMADPYFYPALDARRAMAYEALGDLDEAREALMLAIVGHEAALGGDCPQVAFLRERFAGVQQALDESDPDPNEWEGVRERVELHRDGYLRQAPPRMRDYWQPVDG